MATCGQDVGERGLIPTFKMQRGRRYAYFKQRVPSFTDRVLHRSAPGAKACLSLDTFAATPSLVTSDHKPVFARFKLTAPPAVHPQPEAEALLRCGHNKPPS